MAEDHEVRAVRDAIGRRLAEQIGVDRALPDRLKTLLRALERQDELATRVERDHR